MTQKNKSPKKGGKALHIFQRILSLFLVLLGSVCFFAANWFFTTYGSLGFDSIIYTLTANLGGVQAGLIESYLYNGLLPALILFAVVTLYMLTKHRLRLVFTLFNKVRLQVFPVRRTFGLVFSIIFCVLLLGVAGWRVGLFEYAAGSVAGTTLYEEYYKEPNDVKITFPEKKRNLIYIFLESMEVTYMSKDLGGALDHNAIPELYELAKNNINFSATDGVGGFDYAPSTTWTSAALVAQTAGVPLNVPPGIDENGYGQSGIFLPGLTSIHNILEKEGYHQTLMVGSDAIFGGRAAYFNTHNIDHIYDYYTAIEDKLIPKDYFVWWGFEDKHLFEYAKQELTKIAAQDQPFAFTMLTVDTHHINGYKCTKCRSDFSDPYENVIACSSRQVAAFIQWIQMQDFYENTTIVIAGDHPSMDAAYISRNAPASYKRRVYNCFINSAIDTEYSKNRTCVTMDMFPTTLAAMGCTIEGDRLGLGTNLFSGKPTLSEELGDKYFAELKKSSEFYKNNFYFG